MICKFCSFSALSSADITTAASSWASKSSIFIWWFFSISDKSSIFLFNFSTTSSSSFFSLIPIFISFFESFSLNLISSNSCRILFCFFSLSSYDERNCCFISALIFDCWVFISALSAWCCSIIVAISTFNLSLSASVSWFFVVSLLDSSCSDLNLAPIDARTAINSSSNAFLSASTSALSCNNVDNVSCNSCKCSDFAWFFASCSSFSANLSCSSAAFWAARLFLAFENIFEFEESVKLYEWNY